MHALLRARMVRGLAGVDTVQEEVVVAAVIVFGLLAVAMLAIMLYGVFTEGRRR